MTIPIQLKRGTRAQVDALALTGGLLVGEPLFITDEKQIVVADTVNTVTTPVIFSAYLNASQNPGVQGIFTAWTVLTQIGGGGLDLGGAWTCPRNGWYNCHISLLADNAVTYNSGLNFRVNSTNRFRIGYANNGGPNAQYNMISGDDIVYLNAGDTVRLINESSMLWFGASNPVGRWNITSIT